jgi:ATP dependent DNA ligase-like protein
MKFEFCLPTSGKAVPVRPEWFHEIRYDGYRLRIECDGDQVRLITRGGYNWTGRLPWIVEAAKRNRTKQFVIDGEAVVLCLDGLPDFNALHSRSTMPRSSSAPLTFSLLMARICVICRSQCARPILRGCCEAGRMASLSILSSKARLGRTCFERPATWGWKDWYRSEPIDPTAAGGLPIGSKSRIGRITLSTE